MRRVADAKQSFATPFAQTIDLHCEQLDLRPIIQLGYTIAQKSRESDDLVLKFRQPARLDAVEAVFGNNEAALPVIAAVEQHKKFAVLEKTERLLRIILFFGDAHPEHVDRHAKLAQLETGARVNRRVPPVRSDDEVRAHFHFTARSFRADTDNALILN